MLTRLYNTCLEKSIIPRIWSQSIICPIYKGNEKDRQDPLNYRPISLISNPCKTREGFLRKNIVAVSFFQKCAIYPYS